MGEQLSSENVGEYLVRRGVFTSADGLDIEELTGGVACAVFAVRGEGKRVVVKQALERFRVADEWLVPPERALTEARALELMARLAPGSVPRLLDSDPDAFALVMEEAPAEWRPWKSLLLEGDADAAVAAWLGALLAVLHSADGDIGSAESFEAQRVDPYLRTIQRRHPALADRDRRVHRPAAGDATECVVHGDYSPKNVLVGDDGLWVIDWEVVHRGDPAFDLAFLLNHLLLKTIHRPQAREGYEACGRGLPRSLRSGCRHAVPAGPRRLPHARTRRRKVTGRVPHRAAARARAHGRHRAAQRPAGLAGAGVGRSSTVSP